MNVPKLRFKEFNDEWCLRTLNELYTFKNGINGDKTQFGKGIKYISVGDILNNNYITYDKIKGLIDIDDKTLHENSVEFGDILFQRSSETKKEIGMSNVYLDNKLSTFGGFVIRGKKNKDNNNNPCFINYLLRSQTVRKDIVFRGAGAQHYNIGQEDLKKVSINIPSLAEQNKISSILQLLDKKIELQTKKINDLKLFKKGLIKDIFSSELLKEINIRDIGKIVTGTTPSKENKKYWENGNVTWITPTDINYERDIFSSISTLTREGVEKGRFIPKNSILVTCIASIGKNAVIKVNGSCNQQINAIIPNENYNSNYIYYLMEYISPYLQAIAGTSATAIVNKETFERVKVKVHPLEEQKKIDCLLSHIETKIMLEDKLLHKLKQLKKGLMQNMFI